MKKKWWQISEIVQKWILFHDWIYLLSQQRINKHFAKLHDSATVYKINNTVLVQWEHVSKVWEEFIYCDFIYCDLTSHFQNK